MLLQPARARCKRCVCRVHKGGGCNLESTGPGWGEGTGLDVAVPHEAARDSLAGGELPPTLGSCAALYATGVPPGLRGAGMRALTGPVPLRVGRVGVLGRITPAGDDTTSDSRPVGLVPAVLLVVALGPADAIGRLQGVLIEVFDIELVQVPVQKKSATPFCAASLLSQTRRFWR